MLVAIAYNGDWQQLYLKFRPGSEGLWARQIEFFGSADGAEYFKRLGEQLSRMPPPGIKAN
jgi:hypothetical protein